MANKTQPLTATQVLNAQPKAKEYNLYDGGGLVLRIKPIGTKSWLLNYLRPITKKRVNLSLGKYPLHWSSILANLQTMHDQNRQSILRSYLLISI
jgi:hypothetical protein